VENGKQNLKKNESHLLLEKKKKVFGHFIILNYFRGSLVPSNSPVLTTDNNLLVHSCMPGGCAVSQSLFIL